MKNKLIRHSVFILCCLLFSLFSVAQTPNEFYFRFKIKDKKDLLKITRIVSIDKVIKNEVWAYANRNELNAFNNLQIRYELIPRTVSNSKALTMATTVADMANWDRYPTYGVYEQMMMNYATTYPDICRLVVINTLASGRKLLALEISDNVNVKEDEPEFLYTSSMHGDEVTGYILTLRLIDYLLKNYNTDAYVTNLVNSIDIFINPLANPDGTYNWGNSTIEGSKRYNANDVDLNRNFPDYRVGDHPDGNAWQPENISMMNFASSHHFVMAANFHSGVEVVNYPWDDWTSDVKKHPDDAWYQYVSAVYANKAINASVGTTYMRSLTPNGITNGGDWYVVYGGRQDYMNTKQHCREVTIELSDKKLQDVAELPTMWTYNKDAMLSYMQECLYGIRGIVTNEEGKPLNVTIKIENHDKDNSEMVTDPDVGDYHRMIAAGTYNVTYSAQGYDSKTINNVVVTNGNATIVNVTLKLGTAINESVENMKSSAFPNPFSETVEINFILQHETEAEILIYNVVGGLVYSFPKQTYSSGKNSVYWNSTEEGGLYFYKIKTKDSVVEGKMLKVK